MNVLLATAYPTPWTCLPLFRRLAEQDRFREHQVVEDPDQADIILFVDARHEHNDWELQAIRSHPFVRQFPEKSFVYNEMDQPWCALQGIYVSMPKGSFNSQRQRAYCYANNVNHEVETNSRLPAEPDLLYSFVGRRCHPTRDAILAGAHKRAHLEDTTGIDFFSTAGEEIDRRKRHYAKIVHRSKFVLCPRGAGPTSFRLFETMAAGRVPVIMGDEWVPPSGPRWSDCSIQVPEADVVRLPQLMESHEHHYSTMAERARAEWEEWFAPDVRFHRMVESCADILRTRRLPEAVSQRLPNLRKLWLRGRRVKAMLRDALQKRSVHQA